MTAFIQLTDTHIVPEGQLAYGRSDTGAALVRAVESLRATLPQLDPVDCVVLTGDLTDHGTAEEYQRLRRILAPLPLPLLAIPGNHDSREAMRAAFADMDWIPASGPIHWHHDFGPFSLIALDTLVEGAPYGMICDRGLQFLDRTLNALGAQPVVVATHHPWILSGIAEMDRNNLRNGDRLCARLAAHPAPARVISGHLHRALSSLVDGILHQVAPAPCHAVHLDQRRQAVNSLTLEPGQATLYNWRGPLGGLVSNTINLEQHPGPWPFYPD